MKRTTSSAKPALAQKEKDDDSNASQKADIASDREKKSIEGMAVDDDSLLEDDSKRGEEDKGNEEEDDDDQTLLDQDFYTQFQIKHDAQNRQEMKALLDSFSKEQLQRYEVYRRSGLPKSLIKKLTQNILNQPVSPVMAFVIAGFTKVFVGEIVEQARDIMEEWGDKGALSPEHLREAYRRYREDPKSLPNSRYQPQLF